MTWSILVRFLIVMYLGFGCKLSIDVCVAYVSFFWRSLEIYHILLKNTCGGFETILSGSWVHPLTLRSSTYQLQYLIFLLPGVDVKYHSYHICHEYIQEKGINLRVPCEKLKQYRTAQIKTKMRCTTPFGLAASRSSLIAESSTHLPYH